LLPAPPVQGSSAENGPDATHQRHPLVDTHRWAWRDGPAAHAAWHTVHGLFRRWQRDGTWD
jgi:hypothetical protein